MKLTIQSSGETECVSPEKVASNGINEISEMFGTHDWDVDSGKPLGETGVLLHYNCKKCNAEGYSIIANKGSATSAMIENRVLNFV
jgi:hypothetical protein